MSIGRVLGTAFGVLFGNLWVILGISFLFCGVPQGVINYLQQYAQTLVRDGSATPGMVAALFVSGVLINALCAIVAQGALVRATIGWSRGERVGFGDALVAALRRALPLIGLGIVSGLAFAGAAILLIVPAIILATVWYVSAPVVVVERRGVFGALGRSADLTRGYRWWVFVVLLVVVGFVLVILTFSGLLSGLAVYIAVSGRDMSWLPTIMGVASAIIGTVQTALLGTIPTATYIELRDLQEGPEAQGLDEVFA
jgi:hypothetical protein